MHPRSALWIAPAAVDYVRRNPETASGVRSGQSIFVSKIPYDPVAYLEETDPRMKRYHACHLRLVLWNRHVERVVAARAGELTTRAGRRVAQLFTELTDYISVRESLLDSKQRWACRPTRAHPAIPNARPSW